MISYNDLEVRTPPITTLHVSPATLKTLEKSRRHMTGASVIFSLISLNALVAALLQLNSPFLIQSVIGAIMVLKFQINRLQKVG